MYHLPPFQDADASRILEFIHRNPFAFLTGAGADGRPAATQVPVFIEERDGDLFLSGHLMRNTDHHRAFTANPQVLCVFTGPHAYVSAAWYTDPHQGSTWNYQSVHLRGRMVFGDEAHLAAVLRKTSLHFEGNDAGSPTVFDNLAPAYRERLMKAIIAFEIRVEEMDHVFKLSQNRDAESYDRIIQKLGEGDAGSRAIAQEMELRRNELFPPVSD